MSFTRVGVIVVITAIAVYLGLNLLLPRNQGVQKTSQGTSVDQVFSSNTASTPAAPADNSAAATPPPAQASAPAEQPAATASSDASSSSGSGSSGAAPGDNTAAAAAPAEAAASSSSGTPSQGLSEEEARKIAEEVGRKVATQVASSVAQNAQQNAPAQESAAPAAAESTPAPASAPAESSAATPPPAPAAAPEQPAPAASENSSSGGETAAAPPAPAKPKHPKHEAAASAPAQTAAKPAEKPHTATVQSDRARLGGKTDAISAWWTSVDKQDPSHLNLVYVGEAAFEKAVVLLFSDNVDASTGSQIQLLTRDGTAASGHWEVGQQNQRMLVFRTKPGRYTVILAPGVSGSGKTLGTALHGPVYVH